MILKRLFAGLMAVCLLSGVAYAAVALHEEAREEGLISRLQQGGYVVYLRHAQRYKGPPDHLYPDSPPEAFTDCTHQRNLTPYGIGQATLLGENIRRAGIRVGIVLAHPECRTRDTAMLAFGRVKPDVGMFDSDHVRHQLGISPLPGTNTVLVGGENTLRQIVGFQIRPAEMAIFQPDGHGGTKLIGRLPAGAWYDD